jgi:EAL domain-containing protein (putative c-di-GMP-specific phosphodiesterase class I)
MKVDGSLSGLAVRTGRVTASEDTSCDSRVDGEACRRLGVASTLCVPLLRNDHALGVLNVNSSSPRSFSDNDISVLSNLAEFVGVVVGSASDLDRVTKAVLRSTSSTDGADLPSSSASESHGGAEGDFIATILNPRFANEVVSRQRIERVLETRAFSIVFQPVVELQSRELKGYEALSRFSDLPYRTPDLWFEEANSVGLGLELELAAIDMALSYQSALPMGVSLAINAGPQTITCPDLLGLLEKVDPSQVIVELTEHIEVNDYPFLVRALSDLRSTGVRLAIDDTGSGISSLAHILKLSPEFIKLDRVLTTGIDLDPVRRALAASLVSFAADTNATIVAEGIETGGELEVLRNLGIGHGQGYFLGKPGPL